MLEELVDGLAAAMTAAALWRLPAARRADLRHRALWGCYVGFAGTLWLQTPHLIHVLDHAPVVEGSALLKAYVSVGSLLALAVYMATSSGTYRGARASAHVAVSRWMVRYAPWTAAAVALVMTGLFFTVVTRDRTHADFVASHAGDLGATAYLSVFYLFATATNAVCTYQWGSLLKRADTRTLKAGLGLMTAAMVLGVAYSASRLVWLWTAAEHPYTPAANHAIATGTEYLQLALFLLFAAGAAIPPAGEAVARVAAWRTIRDIYPLWAGLTRAVPGVTADPPGTLVRELTRATPTVTARLDRMTQEVGDICEQLRHYAPKYLLDAAEEASAEHEDPPAAAEAAWINAALVAVAEHDRHNCASQPLPTKPIADSVAEAAWLRRVERVFVTLTEQDGRALLDESRQAA
ncbi:MAB_1171c family putative transporter [Streptacidiphilus sp. EB103A]|uniref:MAB_1171c family putative transporter n=1 Tax=Streptacidiphilus sp. EB103A TaxID=3156275 RepID=UPI0035133A10